MKTNGALSVSALVSGVLAFAATLSAPAPQGTADNIQTARVMPERRQQRPNVLVWMVDDVGFGHVTATICLPEGGGFVGFRAVPKTWRDLGHDLFLLMGWKFFALH